MCLMLLTPLLQGGQVVKVAEPKSFVGAFVGICVVENFHEAVAETSDEHSLLREKIHAFDKNRMHGP